MDASIAKFQSLVEAVLARYSAQNARLVAVESCQRIATQLARVVQHRELPRPLREDEIGEPGGLEDQECARLVEQVMQGVDERALDEVVRQLVKACFYPEFKICRDSFREVSRDGACRRQQLERAVKRVSGAHCVDCPHWVALSPEEHVKYLRSEWCGTPEVFELHRDVFLPEDFRALRRWLHAAARGAKNSD